MNARIEAWSGLSLENPWLLVLALLVPVALFLRRKGGHPAVRFAPAGFMSPALPRSLRGRWIAAPTVLHALGLLLVVVALARPVERTPLPLETEGVDILLCLDVSSSMSALDMDPRRTRLDVAKDAAAEFIAGRESDRIGLIRFARFPDVVCPLTLDHAALTRLLSGVEQVEADGPEDVTGIGTAVARAAQLLGAGVGADPTISRVVILHTDGEENVATVDAPQEIGPLPAAQLSEALGVRVYTIAAGVETVGVGGEKIELDLSQVEQVAEMTGGAFFRVRDARGMASVYASIDELERAPFAEPRYEIQERFVWFLLAAAALLVVGRLLSVTWLEVSP